MTVKKYIFWIILLIMALGYLIMSWYYMPKYTQGALAPDFEFTTLDGEHKKLSDYRGQYVLIDFWGSWCGPCRHENPDLVRLYSKLGDLDYSGDSLAIISIGLETSESRWAKAIEQDSLFWNTHHSSFQRMKDPIAVDFGVKSIPSKFIINPKGYVTGVNQSFAEIETFLTGKIK